MKYKRCCLVTGGPDQGKRGKQVGTVVAVVAVVALILAFAVSEAAGGLVAALGVAGILLWLWLTAEPPSSGGGADPSAINFGR